MISEIVSHYLRVFPDEATRLELLQSQVAAGDVHNDRSTLPGHVTGSGIVLSPDLCKVALIHHKTFNVWQQPGGHWESDEPDPLAAARRECIEELGVTIARHVPLNPKYPQLPLDIDSHFIPANPKKGEADHYHHDFRYVFVAADLALESEDGGVDGAAWFDLADPVTNRFGRTLRKLDLLQLAT